MISNLFVRALETCRKKEHMQAFLAELSQQIHQLHDVCIWCLSCDVKSPNQLPNLIKISRSRVHASF
jgi:hypothetical protein